MDYCTHLCQYVHIHAPTEHHLGSQASLRGAFAESRQGVSGLYMRVWWQFAEYVKG